jgi:orotate phosphoribosyltransferase
VTETEPAQRREQLLDLLRSRAVLHGDFVLSSGLRSSTYLDARLVTLSAAGSGLVGEMLFAQLKDRSVDAVAGLAIGADPLVTAVAIASNAASHPIDGLIVRKDPKDHGTGRQIEGPWKEGLRVAIVEDTMTTGTSALKAAEVITEAGGSVVCLLGLIDREEGAREAAERAGYEFEAIYTSGQILGKD